MRRLLAALLLTPLWAWAACPSGVCWVDISGTGTGAADGTTVANQCAGLTDADCAEAAGDTVYLCGSSTTQTFSVAGASDTSRITFDWTCPGGTPASIDGADVTNDCVIISASHQTHIGDVDDKNIIKDCIKRGIWVDGALSNITVQGFDVSGMPGDADDVGNGTGVIIDNLASPGTTAPVSNIVFSDIVAHHNGRMGFDTFTAGSNIIFRNVEAYENGYLWTGGGLYSHPYTVTVTSGWTDIGGGVYERGSSGANDDIEIVWWNDGGIFLTEVSCGGAIASGEFCYTVGGAGVGFFRINIGTDPAGDTIQYARGSLTNVRWINVWSHHNRAPTGDTVHGTGLQLDNLTRSSSVRGLVAHDNDGAGLDMFRARDNTATAILSFNNGTNTALGTGDRSNVKLQGTGNVINNLTTHGAGTFGIQQGSGTGTCNYCIITGSGEHGARAVTGTLTLNYADIHGNTSGATTTASGGTVTNNSAITTDPQYIGGATASEDEDFCLADDSPAQGLGTYLGAEYLDALNRPYSNPPALGAVGRCAGRPSAATRAAASRAN